MFDESVDEFTVGTTTATNDATGNISITAGTFTAATLKGNLVVADDGDIGSASATDAMQISSGGIVTFKDDILIKNGGTIGSASDADAITIASDGVTTFSQKDVHSVGLSVKNAATSVGFVEFFEDSDNGTNKVTLIGPASTADVTVTLPNATGTLATTTSAASEAIALSIALG
jgi:hypothetical protein